MINIGIDKITLNTLKIVAIDWSKFNSNPACLVKQPINDSHQTVSGFEFSFLQVNTKRDLFSFEVGTPTDKNTGQIWPYQKLIINPASLIYGANIRNISTVLELNKAINIVGSKLNDDYGITIDISGARISEIEINANIQLDQPFSDYEKVFCFIRSALPKKYLKDAKSYISTDGFFVQNTRVCIKFYDKEREARITADEAGRLLRIEYKFKRQEKVFDELGFDTLEALLNNFAAIRTAYKKSIEADILTKIPKAMEAEIARHKRKLIQSIQAQPRAYISEWLAISQDIFDGELMEQALISTLRSQKLTARNNRERIKQLHQLLEKRQEGESELLLGQRTLLNEITHKLTAILGTR